MTESPAGGAPPPAKRRAPRRWVRDAVAAAVLVTVAEILILVSPGPPPERFEEFCVRDFTIRGPAHITASCDAAAYLMLANRPGRMLRPEWPWGQNRPLYAGAGWVLAIPFRALGFDSLPARLFGDRVRPGSDEARYLGYGAEYAGFLLFNWLLLVASVLLLRRVLAARTIFDTPMILPVALLLVNQVTRGFFWTPHLQILNVFAPILSVQLLLWMQQRLPAMTWRDVSLIGLALGVASLMYGIFAMTVSAASLGLIFGDGGNAMRTRPRATLSSVALLMGSFFVPVVAWSTFAGALAGSYTSPETAAYREFVWVADSFARGANVFLTDLVHHLDRYLSTVPGIVAFPTVTLAALSMTFYALGAARIPVAREKMLGRAILLCVVADVVFYALMGYYALRLTWSIVPLLAILIGMEIGSLERALAGRARSALRLVTVVVALCYAAFSYASPYNNR